MLYHAGVRGNPRWAYSAGRAGSAAHAINPWCYCLWHPHSTASHSVVYIERGVFVKCQKNSEVSRANLAKGPTALYKN